MKIEIVRQRSSSPSDKIFVHTIVAHRLVVAHISGGLRSCLDIDRVHGAMEVGNGCLPIIDQMSIIRVDSDVRWDVEGGINSSPFILITVLSRNVFPLPIAIIPIEKHLVHILARVKTIHSCRYQVTITLEFLVISPVDPGGMDIPHAKSLTICLL